MSTNYPTHWQGTYRRQYITSGRENPSSFASVFRQLTSSRLSGSSFVFFCFYSFFVFSFLSEDTRNSNFRRFLDFRLRTQLINYLSPRTGAVITIWWGGVYTLVSYSRNLFFLSTNKHIQNVVRRRHGNLSLKPCRIKNKKREKQNVFFIFISVIVCRINI